MLELCWIQVGPCWVHVGATWSSAGTTSAHVRSKLGLGWPILGLCWGCNSLSGPMLAHLGAMLAQLRCMLGPGSPILALCWGYVGPSGAYVGAMFAHLGAPRRWFWGYVVFMSSPSFPKFCLKKLSPVACEAPTSFLQHHFSEKAESWWGRAHPRWAPEGSRQWPARFQVTLPKGSTAPHDPPLAKLDLLQWRSPQSPPSFTLRTFSLPPVACESHRPPKRGRRHKVGPLLAKL